MLNLFKKTNKIEVEIYIDKDGMEYVWCVESGALLEVNDLRTDKEVFEDLDEQRIENIKEEKKKAVIRPSSKPVSRRGKSKEEIQLEKWREYTKQHRGFIVPDVTRPGKLEWNKFPDGTSGTYDSERFIRKHK